MKNIGIIIVFLVFGIASAQTDTVKKTIPIKTVKDNTSVGNDAPNKMQKNPDGTIKITKTYQGQTKPNTNATKNNTTGSPDPVRRPTDTITTPSGTLGPDRTKGSNTTKSTVPNGTSPLPNTGTTVPRT